MQRRHLLSTVSGTFAMLAGCSSDNENSSDPTGSEVTGTSSNVTDTETTETPSTETQTSDEEQSLDESDLPEEFPGITTLVDEHLAAVTSTSFESTEYEANEENSREITRQHGEAGMLLTDQSESAQYWFTDNVNVTPDTHTYFSGGIRLPAVNRQGMKFALEGLIFERVEVLDEEVPVAVFESTEGKDSGYESVSGRVEITALGYVRMMNIKKDYPEEAFREFVEYRHEVTGVGDTTVDTPDFAEAAVHIEGRLQDDRSWAVLEHTGGATIESGTQLRVTDAASNVVFDRAPSLPSDFTEGDTAYVYFSGEEEAAITVGEVPSNIARPFDTGDEGETVFIQEQDEDARLGLGRFKLVFGEGTEGLY